MHIYQLQGIKMVILSSYGISRHSNGVEYRLWKILICYLQLVPLNCFVDFLRDTIFFNFVASKCSLIDGLVTSGIWNIKTCQVFIDNFCYSELQHRCSVFLCLLLSRLIVGTEVTYIFKKLFFPDFCLKNCKNEKFTYNPT